MAAVYAGDLCVLGWGNGLFAAGADLLKFGKVRRLPSAATNLWVLESAVGDAGGSQLTLGEACRMTGWHVYRTQIKGTHRDGMLREANREAMDMPPLTLPRSSRSLRER